jgi:thymidylate synthase (FAD)
MQITPPDGWRAQAMNNKQGSGGTVTNWPDAYTLSHTPAGDDAVSGAFDSPGAYLTDREKELQGIAREIYEERLKFGVAREQARKDLPLSTYTEAFWKCDLRNVFHFLGLRMDSHAQAEIRAYADIIGREIVAPLFPLCWEAFEDYTLGAVTLSALEVRAVRLIAAEGQTADVIPSLISNGRERDECRAKLTKLGLI